LPNRSLGKRWTCVLREPGVNDGQRQRPGRRSNGSVFTVDTLGRYVAHDVHDVGG
jgi:hypothetical protein